MTYVTRLVLAAATMGAMLCTDVAAYAAPPGAACSNTSSAINQYCENVPSATGRSTPPRTQGSTAPALGTTLPQAAVRTFEHLRATAKKRARKLLSLPAPSPRVPVSGSIAVPNTAWSPSVGVILALVAIAAAGAVAAIARRRRRT